MGTGSKGFLAASLVLTVVAAVAGCTSILNNTECALADKNLEILDMEYLSEGAEGPKFRLIFQFTMPEGCGESIACNVSSPERCGHETTYLSSSGDYGIEVGFGAIRDGFQGNTSDDYITLNLECGLYASSDSGTVFQGTTITKSQNVSLES